MEWNLLRLDSYFSFQYTNEFVNDNLCAKSFIKEVSLHYNYVDTTFCYYFLWAETFDGMLVLFFIF